MIRCSDIHIHRANPLLNRDKEFRVLRVADIDHITVAKASTVLIAEGNSTIFSNRIAILRPWARRKVEISDPLLNLNLNRHSIIDVEVESAYTLINTEHIIMRI